MVEILIDGNKYPMRATIGAWKNFEESTGVRAADLGKESKDDESGPNQLILFAELAFHFVNAGCKKKQIDFDLSLDDWLDSIEMSDFKMLNDALKKLMKGKETKKKMVTR